MKKYIAPKIEFLKMGTSDILTASFGVGIDLPEFVFNKVQEKKQYFTDTFLNDVKDDKRASADTHHVGEGSNSETNFTD